MTLQLSNDSTSALTEFLWKKFRTLSFYPHVYNNYIPMIPPMRGGKVTLPPKGCKVITLHS